MFSLPWRLLNKLLSLTLVHQVRQKMYQGSSEAWRNYESYLGELKEALNISDSLR